MLCLPPGAHIHLIGACGTAMGSLGGLLRAAGHRVTGSDAHVYPPMSQFLAEDGLPVAEGFSADNLTPRPDLVVVGNVVSRGNPELEAVLDAQIPYTSFPEALRDLFLVGRRPVVVTGTHGKTTTTALTTWLLRAAQLDPSYLVAGLPRDLPRPYALGSGDLFVLEGDEYDSAYFAKVAKFLFYRPSILIVNNLEFDHADIYGDLDEIKRAFRQVVNQVPRHGLICANGDDENVADVLAAAPAPVLRFGLGTDNDWRADAIEVTPGGTRFDVVAAGEPLGRFRMALTGDYNVRNALGGLAVARHVGVDIGVAQRALADFGGVRRRQEPLGTVDGVCLIDDFAHHPTAVGQTLQGLRAAHPEGCLWAVFEPASASNARKVFEDRYLEAFRPADAVVLAPVPRPERARGDEPFSSDRLAQRLIAEGRRAWSEPDAAAIARRLAAETRPGDTVVFMSNGGFGGVQQQTLEALQARL